MIWFSAIDSAAGAAKYFTPDGRDYHVEDERTYAFFAGKGAEKLGLDDFDLTQFKRMLHGLHPTENRKLTVGAKKATNRCGYEVIFDCPKDVSVLWGLGQDYRIPGLLELAMRETLDVIEQDAKVRVRAGKADHDRTSGNMVAAAVLHTTSREENGKVDSHLHYHVLIPNASWDPVERKWKALQLQAWGNNGDRLDRPHYAAVFHSRLAHHLQQLGYETEKTKDAFRVVGITDDVRREFSQRTQTVEAKKAEIEEKVREERDNPNYKLSAKQTAKLAAIYRQPKQPGRSMESLAAHWESRVTENERNAVRALVAQANMPLAAEDRSREAVAFALEHLTARQSVVPERKVITEALRFGIGGVTLEDVTRDLRSRKDVVHAVKDGVRMVTTTHVQAEEDRIRTFAIRGRNSWKPLGTAPNRADADLAPLSRTQFAAVSHGLTSRDRVIVIEGKAGVGKSTLLKPLLKRVKVPWLAVATSSDASRTNLAKDPFFAGAETVAALFARRDLQEQVRGGLLVVDETSLTGTQDFARLTELADQLSFQILVLGDRGQHKSVARGDLMRLLTDKAGLPVAVVDEIQRQKGDYRVAADLLSRGQVHDGFQRLDGLGWIKEGGLVADYMQALREKKESLIVCPTHAEGDRITGEVRQLLRQEQVLSGEDRQFVSLRNLQVTDPELKEMKKKLPAGVVLGRFGAYAPESVCFAVGDQLRITGGGKDLAGRRLDNGMRFTVTGFTEAGNIQVRNAESGMDRVIGKDYGHFRHGYVETSFGSQGKTVDRVFIAMPSQTFPAVDMATAYVTVTRGREQARIYTDAKEGLQRMWERQDNRLLASDLVPAPPKKFRQRLKLHAQSLRQAASRAMGRTQQLEQEAQRGFTYEQGA